MRTKYKTAVCTKCHKRKSVEAFYSNGIQGKRPDCDSCNSKKSTLWGSKNKLKHYGYSLVCKRGVTLEQYMLKLKAQNFRCAICGRHDKDLKQRLGVDHNHSNNQIRGLLCVTCNQGLGHFKDSPVLLKMAIEYLEIYKCLE